MYDYLGFLLFSFIITSLAIVPFINLLYSLNLKRRRQKTIDPLGKNTTVFDRFHNSKVGTPVGGGVLIVVIISLLYALLLPSLQRLGINFQTAFDYHWESKVLFFTLLSFAVIGLYDDVLKSFNFRQRGFFGLRFRQKLFIQLAVGLIVGWLLYDKLGIDIIHLPLLNVTWRLGVAYVLVAAVIVVGFANAYNITDGLDGLSSGVLMVCLFAFWALSYSSLDTTLSIFISLWLGSLLAFLYFNIYPARIWLGDVGALAFGATLAVIGLLLGKIVALMVIGGIFLLEALSSTLQLVSKRFWRRRLIPAAPLHLTLQKYGWEEPKIVFRAWILAILLGILGLWLAMI